jgi:hypothetical protein
VGPGIAAEASFRWIGSNRRERLWLWWQGRLDGRRGIVISVTSAGAAITPQIEALCKQACEVFEAERSRMLADVANIQHRGEELRLMLPDLQAALEDAEERLKRVTAAGPGRYRRTGEGALDEAVVTRRRRREHDKDLAALRADVAERQGELRTAKADLAATPRQVERTKDDAALRSAQYGHFTRKRIAGYWRAFARARRRGTRSGDGWYPLPDPWTAWTRERGGPS